MYIIPSLAWMGKKGSLHRQGGFGAGRLSCMKIKEDVNKTFILSLFVLLEIWKAMVIVCNCIKRSRNKRWVVLPSMVGHLHAGTRGTITNHCLSKRIRFFFLPRKLYFTDRIVIVLIGCSICMPIMGHNNGRIMRLSQTGLM